MSESLTPLEVQMLTNMINRAIIRCDRNTTSGMADQSVEKQMLESVLKKIR